MQPCSRFGLVAALLCATVGSAFAADPPAVTELPCLPIEGNAAVQASIAEMPAGAELRLYFRRLNPRGAFYYNRMIPAAAGSYWSVLPRPEDRAQHRLDDEWWKILGQRDWMQVPDRDRQWLEGWLEQRQQEAAEYYVASHAASGEQIERSDVRLVEVLPPDDCPTRLNAHEAGWAENLTVGETTELQAGRQLLHWLCDGVVTRISARGIWRADDFCRPCVLGANRARRTDAAMLAP